MAAGEIGGGGGGGGQTAGVQGGGRGVQFAAVVMSLVSNPDHSLIMRITCRAIKLQRAVSEVYFVFNQDHNLIKRNVSINVSRRNLTRLKNDEVDCINMAVG